MTQFTGFLENLNEFFFLKSSNKDHHTQDVQPQGNDKVKEKTVSKVQIKKY